MKTTRNWTPGFKPLTPEEIQKRHRRWIRGLNRELPPKDQEKFLREYYGSDYDLDLLKG